MSHVDPGNAHTEEYRKTLLKIVENGTCPAPFCKDEGNDHKHRIEEVWEHWKVTRNSFNYQNAKIPFLLVLRQHIERFEEVPSEAWAELFEVIQHLVSKHQLAGASLVWRFGQKSNTGASVTHLHAHLIACYGPDEGTENVMVFVGKGIKKEEESNEKK